MGRMLIVAGLAILILGVVVTYSPVRLGRLPGDIVIRGKNSTFYFPVVTCLILSGILSLVGWLFSRR